jgi:hypothetical protein
MRLSHSHHIEAVCLDTGVIFEVNSTTSLGDSYVSITPMHRLTVRGVVLFLAGCGARINAAGDAPSSDDAASAADATTDAADSVDAQPLGPWSTPAKIGRAATTAAEDDVTLSSDALELIFAIAGTVGKDLFYTSRPSKTEPWAPVAKLPCDTDNASEETPRFSADDRALYFASDRADTATLDIYIVRRPERGSSLWGTPVRLDAVSTDKLVEKWFMPCSNDCYVMAQTAGTVGTDLVEGTLGGGPPTTIAELSSTENDTGPFLTQDCLTIYFASNRSGSPRIYTSHRTTVTEPWPAPTPVLDFPIAGTSDGEEDPWLSPDGRTFAFARDKDIYVSTR